LWTSAKANSELANGDNHIDPRCSRKRVRSGMNLGGIQTLGHYRPDPGTRSLGHDQQN